MATNKFATMLHKNTNKITLVLIYAVLEWTLILLLLLNSLFSYLIIKYARFFGLKPPCLWCIRLDRFFEPKNKNSHREYLCEFHSKEISQLGFCSKHRKLAESNELCEDCSDGLAEKSKSFVFSKAKKIDFVESKEENKAEVCVKCSCCGVEFVRKSFDDSSYFVINPSWDFISLSKNGNSVLDLIGSDLVSDNLEEKTEDEKQGKTEETGDEIIKDDLIQFEKKENISSDLPTQDLEFFLDYSGNQLVPIETVDENEEQEFGEFQKAQAMSESKIETVTEELVMETRETLSVLQNTEDLITVSEKTEEKTEEIAEDLSKFAQLDSMEFEETENALVFHANLSGSPDEKLAVSEANGTPLDSEELKETEEGDSDQEDTEVSIGTEIPVLDSCDEIKAQDNFTLYSLSHEEPSTSSNDLDFNLEYEGREDEKIEEVKNLNQVDDTLLMIERKDSVAEESFDGSEMEVGDAINTNEKLKSALRAERKALQALYIELEEERSASAVAASETMAMINRLQEEKAAMQMEALHYQRMMEEQSEYDQEALQLLNDLMVKKEKELEMYRKKVSEYETKDRMRFLASSVKSGTCSASCSHSEDGDGLWVDLNHDPKENGISNGNQDSQHQNTPIDSVLNLDSSFVDFEDERLSILEQLKVLEEKLFILSDEEDRHFGDVRQIEDYFEENGKHLNGNGNYGYEGHEANGITNGFPKEILETPYQDRRSIGSMGKRLLPLFDALETESDDGAINSNGHENGFHPNTLEDTAVTRFELQKKRIDMEEEVDQLYVRLQALEADREFLKHCIGSLKKGDKGMELLQEILQHLRDLRSVDLRAKSFTDGTLV
ncbi:Zein-binding domain-containing protein [Artemisia annua]|uniref:Zein-binding domain-containing protein n=1 Tax=Artemisia annua TaxID=35608 RepID=A0A2U1N104_ARTAN|nr:Zein-binding domain-containing protein [Artemisia annua]